MRLCVRVCLLLFLFFVFVFVFWIFVFQCSFLILAFLASLSLSFVDFDCGLCSQQPMSLLSISPFSKARGEALSEPEPIGKGAVEVLELHLPSAIPPAVAGTAGPPLEAFHPIPFHGPKDAPQRLAIDVFAWDLQKSLERCRLFKVPWTMAFLTALAFTGCPDRLKTAVGCPLNSRQMVGLPVNELLNAGVPMGTMVERLDTFWTSAVATAASFKVNVGLLDFPRMVVNSYRTSMEAVPPGEPWPRRNPTEIQVPFIVSNMGPCSIPGVDILFGALGICHGGSVLIHVHTLGLKTFFSFSTMEPLYSVGRMKEIIVEALRLIENATE